jgi:hypothetical protein
MNRDAGIGVFFMVKLDKTVKVKVKYRVAVKQDKIFAKRGADAKQRTGRTQRFVFVVILYGTAEFFAVPKVIVDNLPKVAGYQYNIGKAVAFKTFNLVFQDGFTAKGDHGFGNVIGNLGNSFALTPRHNYGLQL